MLASNKSVKKRGHCDGLLGGVYFQQYFGEHFHFDEYFSKGSRAWLNHGPLPTLRKFDKPENEIPFRNHHLGSIRGCPWYLVSKWIITTI